MMSRHRIVRTGALALVLSGVALVGVAPAQAGHRHWDDYAWGHAYGHGFPHHRPHYSHAVYGGGFGGWHGRPIYARPVYGGWHPRPMHIGYGGGHECRIFIKRRVGPWGETTVKHKECH
jgi:hypothetical protein